MKVGQQLFYVSRYGAKSIVTVVRVGRKYAYITVGRGEYRIELGQDKVQTLDGQYLIGTVYASEATYNDVLALRAAWTSLREELSRLSYYPQEGMTIKRISQIRRLLSGTDSKDTLENDKENSEATK